MLSYLFFMSAVVLFIYINIYFKVADKYDIIDKPNERSSHSIITLRGGGVVFPMSVLLYSVYELIFFQSIQYPFFLFGLIIVSVVSFWDDIKTIGSGVRLLAHLSAVLLMFYEIDLFSQVQWFWCFIFLVIAIANINAFNFMDGINGISVLHYITVLGSALIVCHQTAYIHPDFLQVVLGGMAVFAFYNLRSKAKCFAGDVGSVSAALICMFVVYQVIAQSGDFKYILLMFVFGLDSIVTIAIRGMKKENILKPHRMHLYQYLANEAGMKHVYVALIYFLVQAFVDFMVIRHDLTLALLVSLLIAVIYIMTRLFVFKRYVLPKG